MDFNCFSFFRAKNEWKSATSVGNLFRRKSLSLNSVVSIIKNSLMGLIFAVLVTSDLSAFYGSINSISCSLINISRWELIRKLVFGKSKTKYKWHNYILKLSNHLKWSELTATNSLSRIQQLTRWSIDNSIASSAKRNNGSRWKWNICCF